MAIKGYHTDDVIFNTSEFIDNLLKKEQKIRFSGAGASHQNRVKELTIKMVVTMVRTMFMQAALRYPKDTFPTSFGQRKWTILYGSTIVYLI